MYYEIKFKNPCKVAMENVYSGEKKTFEFSANQVVSGRLDRISGKTILVTDEGWGSSINEGLVETV